MGWSVTHVTKVLDLSASRHMHLRTGEWSDFLALYIKALGFVNILPGGTHYLALCPLLATSHFEIAQEGRKMKWSWPTNTVKNVPRQFLRQALYQTDFQDTYLPKISSNSPTPLNCSVSYMNLKWHTCTRLLTWRYVQQWHIQDKAVIDYIFYNILLIN